MKLQVKQQAAGRLSTPPGSFESSCPQPPGPACAPLTPLPLLRTLVGAALQQLPLELGAVHLGVGPVQVPMGQGQGRAGQGRRLPLTHNSCWESLGLCACAGPWQACWWLGDNPGRAQPATYSPEQSGGHSVPPAARHFVHPPIQGSSSPQLAPCPCHPSTSRRQPACSSSASIHPIAPPVAPNTIRGVAEVHHRLGPHHLEAVLQPHGLKLVAPHAVVVDPGDLGVGVNHHHL